MIRKTVVTAAALALGVRSRARWRWPLASSAMYAVLVISNDTFGGCMAQLSVDPQSVLPACQSRPW